MLLALEHFDKGLAVNPKYFQCAFNKGNILLNKQNYSGALKTFLKPFMINEDAFILDPQNKHYEKFIPKISQSIEAIAHSENTLSQIHRKIIKQLIEFGETKRGWLGVRIQDVTKEIAEVENLEGRVQECKK